jgi:putative peptidoglycan lipid II flippase
MVSVMTLLSRVMGLTRDIVLAHLLGVSAGTDAFFVAFRVPNFLRRLFAEGAFNQAFVPVLSEYRTRGPLAATQELLNRVTGTLGGILFWVAVIGVVGAPVLVTLFAPGFSDDPHKRALTVEMLRITFPYIFFISLTALAGGVLNTWNRFAVPAFTPVLMNLCLIGAAIFVTPLFAPPRMAVALAWGVLAAGFVQLLFQVPFLWQLGLLPKPRFFWHDPGVQKILKLMLPALFGVSVSQINLLLDTVLASLLTTGSVTWLYYSDRLNELPLGVFGIAIATVILPSLSKKHAAKSAEAFSNTLDWALRLVLLIGWPAALAVATISQPLLSSLFQYGEFTSHDVLMASWSLEAYSVGLLAFMFIKILAPGFYARQDTKTPVKIGVITLVANMLLMLALIYPLKHAGLALATSLAAWLNAGLLYWRLRRDDVFHPRAGWWLYLLRLALAGIAMAGVLWWLAGSAEHWYQWSAISRVEHLALLILAGLATYVLVLFITGMKYRHLRHYA